VLSKARRGGLSLGKTLDPSWTERDYGDEERELLEQDIDWNWSIREILLLI
jgi:hypothetical protein